jgi:hypothetical protein
MRFSYVMLPDYPLEESLRAIKLADELGFYACYAADETWHKDLWLLFAAAAKDTTNIRLGQASSERARSPRCRPGGATLDELPTVAPKWCSDQATSVRWRSTTSTGNGPAVVPVKEGVRHPEIPR